MKRNVAMVCAVVAVALGGGYWIGRARADGIPTMTPMFYGGYLEDGGRPVDGMRDVTLRLWDSAMGGTLACAETTASTMVQAGRWRIAVDPACVMAVQRTSELWTEVIVNGTSFGRSKIGAVPFAVEAGRAAAASGGLATRIAAVEARAMPRQVVVRTGETLAFIANANAIFRISASGVFQTGTTVGGTGGCNLGYSIQAIAGMPMMLESFGVTARIVGFSVNTGGSGSVGIPQQGQLSGYFRLTAGTMYTFGVGTDAASCAARASSYLFVAEQME